jgi:hypothetical protein
LFQICKKLFSRGKNRSAKSAKSQKTKTTKKLTLQIANSAKSFSCNLRLFFGRIQFGLN